MANRKGFLLTILATIAGATVTSFAMSEHLFNIAFKRVNYVPETSEEKQKYADEYWAYVDWFKQAEKERWTFESQDGDGEMSAYFIPAKDGNKEKAVIISHGYKGNGETMASYAKLF